MKTILLITSMLALCSGCAALDIVECVLYAGDPPTYQETLAAEQAAMFDCTEEYMECLNSTKQLSSEWEEFNAAIDDCINQANSCPK